MDENGNGAGISVRSFDDWVKSVFATYGAGLFVALLMATVLTKVFFTKILLPIKLDLLAQATTQYFWDFGAQTQILVPTTAYHYFRTLVFAPVFEESARVAVFLLLLNFASKWKKHELGFVVIVLSGGVFGILHGQVIAAFIQGAVGAVIGFMFVRMQCRSQYPLLVSYAACVAVHFMYNLTVTVLR